MMEKLKIGITGMAGFVGSHLRDGLKQRGDIEVLPFEDSYYQNPEAFIDFAKKADVIVALRKHEGAGSVALAQVRVALPPKEDVT